MHDDIDNVDNDEDGDVTVEWMDEGVDCLASALAGQSVTAYIRFIIISAAIFLATNRTAIAHCECVKTLDCSIFIQC